MSKAIKASGNSRHVGRTVGIVVAEDMSRFDALPRQVREVCRNLMMDVCCVGLQKLCRDYGAELVAAEVSNCDRSAAEKFVAAEFGRDAVDVLIPRQPGANGARRQCAAPAQAARRKAEDQRP